jgi:hypothetical protein
MATPITQQIEQALNQHFPTGGREEVLNKSDPAVKELRAKIYKNWSELPARLQQKIEDIEEKMNERGSFTLRKIG